MSQAEAELGREEAAEALAETQRRDGLAQRLEAEAAEEVRRWEQRLRDKEKEAMARCARREQQLMGESKASEQVASALRVRELALRAGARALVSASRS